MLSSNAPRSIAWLNLRHSVPERQKAFVDGLTKAGYTVRAGFPGRIGARDCFVTWNRIGDGHTWAKRFEAEGNRVLVAENSTWGNGFLGRHWYCIFPDYHNAMPVKPFIVDPSRFDALNVPLAPWRPKGETLILPQRGIGPPGIAMPQEWPRSAAKRYKGRVRLHPGRDKSAKSLEEDLQSVGLAVTWGSGAAVKALMVGVRVISEMPRWIGQQDNTDQGRLEMLRCLAMYQWTLEEIAAGEPFTRLLR